MMKKYLNKRLATFQLGETDLFVKEIQLDIDKDFQKVTDLVEKFKPFVTLYTRGLDKAHIYIKIKPFATWTLIKENLSSYKCSSKLFHKICKTLSTAKILNPQLALLNEITFKYIYKKLIKMFNADPIFASNTKQGICRTWELRYYDLQFRAKERIDLYDLAKMVLDKNDMIDIFTEFMIRLDDIIFNKHYNPLMRFKRKSKMKRLLNVSIHDLKLMLQKLIETGIYQQGNRQTIWMCLNGIAYRYITKDRNKRLQLFEQYLYPLIERIDEEHHKRLDAVRYDEDKDKARYGFPRLIEVIEQTDANVGIRSILGHLNFTLSDDEVEYRRKSFKETGRRTSFYDAVGVVGMFLINLWLTQQCTIDEAGNVTFEIKSFEFKHLYRKVFNKQLPNLNMINKVLNFLVEKKVLTAYKTKGFSNDKRYIIESNIENLTTAKSLICLDMQTQLPIIFMKKDLDVFETYNTYKSQLVHPHRQSLIQLIIFYFRFIIDQISIDTIINSIKLLEYKFDESVYENIQYISSKFYFGKLRKFQQNGKWIHALTSKEFVKDYLQYEFLDSLPSTKKQLQKFINFIKYQILDTITQLLHHLMETSTDSINHHIIENRYVA